MRSETACATRACYGLAVNRADKATKVAPGPSRCRASLLTADLLPTKHSVVGVADY